MRSTGPDRSSARRPTTAPAPSTLSSTTAFSPIRAPASSTARRTTAPASTTAPSPRATGPTIRASGWIRAPAARYTGPWWFGRGAPVSSPSAAAPSPPSSSNSGTTRPIRSQA